MNPRQAAAGARVLVVGDVMLDRYWFGDVHRISPEAPVPVVKIEKTDERLGGAANVARNAAALGASVTLLSVVGDDEPGRMIRLLLESAGIRTALHVDAQFKTKWMRGSWKPLRRISCSMPFSEILRSPLTACSRKNPSVGTPTNFPTSSTLFRPGRRTTPSSTRALYTFTQNTICSLRGQASGCATRVASR